MSSRRRFLVLTFVALLGIAATAWLGRWQMSRGEMRERTQMAIDVKHQLPALQNSAIAAWPTELTDDMFAQILHRTAQLRGQWLTGHTVFLDNRQMFGRPGFYVLTPFQLEGSSRVLVVQRGWVARNFVDRSQLPVVPTPVGLVEVNGRLAGPPGRLLELGGSVEPPADNLGNAAEKAVGIPVIRQNLDLKTFAMETKLALMPLTLLQTEAPSVASEAGLKDGLQRDWPMVNSGASKNYGYAAQWFALSALIAGLYGWFQFGKPYVAKKRS